ncbi:MAG: radical SAM protein [Lentisphaerae bacterium RIFOXYA12_FULL_48_11]|nr:MAG: radical SAM protein [Lentisphaerae bacterium RIFOXYA12_FULL_48_11]
MKLLLTSVFGPFGVDDAFGCKENKMELFHNQITREQGLFSYRFHHNSFGLYFLAENVDTPTTVLDFPELKDFIHELANDYDYVGISFVIPNVKKAREMARLIRKHSPRSKIILGGHGTTIPGIEDIVEHDYICRGEGVRFLRSLLNENPDKAIRHPLVHSSFDRKIMGFPLPTSAGVVIPGVGCVNKCRFCVTSHFFGGYTAYLKTGQDIYNVCLRYEKEFGVTDFGVLDENFLKDKKRALELLNLMEANNKLYTFSIFSSAETLTELGDLDLLVRMGIQFVWFGVESRKELFEKNKAVDFHALVQALQMRGISVLTSFILFLEHHDKKTILEDIDYAISLKPDYLQFMQLGPYPGTMLYSDYEKQNILLKDIPYEEQHGQDKIWFRHNHFTREETSLFTRMAFRKDYELNGASLVRYMNTTIKGYNYILQHPNEFIRKRAKDIEVMLDQMRYFLPALRIFTSNASTTAGVDNVTKHLRRIFQKKQTKTLIAETCVTLLACKEFLKIKTLGDTSQPACFQRKYNSNNINMVKCEP